MKTEIGYTLVECYHANDNYKGQQKQYVLKVDGKIKNVFLKSWVNAPSDLGRSMTYYHIADISESDYEILKKISDNHKMVNWNKGQYDVYGSAFVSKKAYNLVEQAKRNYIKLLHDTYEPFNQKEIKKAKKLIKRVMLNYFSKKEYKNCEKYIY